MPQHIIMQELSLCIQYCEIDDTDTPTERHIKLMMDWMILHKIREEFNGRYLIGDSTREEFNGKGDGCFVVDILIMI